MYSVTNLIGERFENVMSREFPCFKRNGLERLTPDFHGGEFYVEVKTGQKEYSIAPKKYQIDTFAKLSLPVVYCIGFHDFEDAHKRLAHRSVKSARKVLEEEMNILCAYFVSQQVIAKMFEKESRLNQKQTIHYCALKKRMFDQIIANTPCSRKGEIVSPHDWYGLERKECIMSEPREVVSSFPYGYILHTRTDKEVIQFLKKKRIIPT